MLVNLWCYVCSIVLLLCLVNNSSSIKCDICIVYDSKEAVCKESKPEECLSHADSCLTAHFKSGRSLYGIEKSCSVKATGCADLRKQKSKSNYNVTYCDVCDKDMCNTATTTFPSVIAVSVGCLIAYRFFN